MDVRGAVVGKKKMAAYDNSKGIDPKKLNLNDCPNQYNVRNKKIRKNYVWRKKMNSDVLGSL